MTIQLISEEVYNKLLQIQKEYPILTFDNRGYEYIDKSKFSTEDHEAFAQVTAILKEHIEGFRVFNNFKIRKNGEIVLRFQYDWSSSFTGVGYLGIEELYKGFKEKDHE